MPKRITMPSTGELPAGPCRDFVAELFAIYRAADSPPLHEVEELIRNNESLKGNPSKELVRRMLKGDVPHRWANVEAAAWAFMTLANYDPEELVWQDAGDDYNAYEISRIDAVKLVWRKAVDNVELPYRVVVPKTRPVVTDDPWARAAPQGNAFDDEPPF